MISLFCCCTIDLYYFFTHSFISSTDTYLVLIIRQDLCYRLEYNGTSSHFMGSQTTKQINSKQSDRCYDLKMFRGAVQQSHSVWKPVHLIKPRAFLPIKSSEIQIQHSFQTGFHHPVNLSMGSFFSRPIAP